MWNCISHEPILWVILSFFIGRESPVHHHLLVNEDDNIEKGPTVGSLRLRTLKETQSDF